MQELIVVIQKEIQNCSIGSKKFRNRLNCKFRLYLYLIKFGFEYAKNSKISNSSCK